jgi:hypothetical protein
LRLAAAERLCLNCKQMTFTHPIPAQSLAADSVIKFNAKPTPISNYLHLNHVKMKVPVSRTLLHTRIIVIWPHTSTNLKRFCRLETIPHLPAPSSDFNHSHISNTGWTIHPRLHLATCVDPLPYAYKRPVLVFPQGNSQDFFDDVSFISRPHRIPLVTKFFFKNVFEMSTIDRMVDAANIAHTVFLRHPAFQQVEQCHTSGVLQIASFFGWKCRLGCQAVKSEIL